MNVWLRWWRLPLKWGAFPNHRRPRKRGTDGEPFTAHTTNPVPFYIVGANVRLRDGRLADIAPTMLDLMGLEKPAEMDGETLIVT